MGAHTLGILQADYRAGAHRTRAAGPSWRPL